MNFIKTFILTIVTFASISVFAKGGGGHSFGFNLGMTTVDQKDINTVIKNTNTAVAGVSTSELGNAWELSAFYQYRMTSMSALQFRPSYFFQSEDSTGGYEYDTNGFTIFPILKFYLLEDNYVKFFTNLGVGWGMINGTIKDGPGESVEFSGHNLGYMAGLGAEFCLFGGDHCINLEANFRYLAVERFIADSGSGPFTRSITQANEGDEVEINGRDLGANMSGVNLALGYVLHF